MRALLDTHTFLWWIADDQNLSRRAREVISDGDSEIFLSVASGWEIAIKARLGRLSVPKDIDSFLAEQLERNAFMPLPIQMKHVAQVSRLPEYHADPFDHLLIAQAHVENLILLTKDKQIKRYDVKTLW